MAHAHCTPFDAAQLALSLADLGLAIDKRARVIASLARDKKVNEAEQEFGRLDVVVTALWNRREQLRRVLQEALVE